MAMDTRDKRSSAINTSLPFRGQLPAPGTLTIGDRIQVANLYRGIGESVGGDDAAAIAGGMFMLFG